MNTLTKRTEKYLADFLEGPVRLEKVESVNLPLFLRERYSLWKAVLFDKSWLLAIEADDWNMGTPREYRQQLRILADNAKGPVVLVLGATTSTLRNRLILLNVPFIVPGTQVFLPMAFINLKERYSPYGEPSTKRLTPTAQLLVLYQILIGQLHDLSSKQIAAKLGCSSMMITKARKELESRDICNVKRIGKEARILFPADTKTLWKKVLPSLASPVGKKHWVQWDQPLAGVQYAGMTALSQRSLIADDEMLTFALKRQVFTDMVKRGQIRVWPDQHGAQARIECWSYDPSLLSDGPLVDPLSLYLSLRYDHDERVQGELATMMKELQWR